MILEAAAPDSGIPGEWVLYGGLITFIVGIIGGATPKLLKAFGELGEAAQQRLDRQREAARASDDADIKERDRQIAYLEGVAAERLREIRARDILAAEHAPWDWERFRAAVEAGHEVDPPPPLIPEIPPPPHETPGETG